MFNKAVLENELALAFVRSLYIQAYPCSRRRSTKVDADRNVETDDKYYIPFDPEARLNTELNNRRHTSLNGFTQTYINSVEDKLLSIVLGGYLFNISLKTDDISAFGNSIIGCIKDISTNVTDAKRIYANIRIEDTPLYNNALYSTTLSYFTEILRDQSQETTAKADIDLPAIDGATDPEDFYFSGLSFSTQPLTGDTSTRSITRVEDNSAQQVISLVILDKVGEIEKDGGKKEAIWQVHQPAFLPNITHGDTEDSVVIKELKTTGDLKRPYTIINSDGTSVVKTGKVPVIDIVQENEKYQLQFFNVNSN